MNTNVSIEIRNEYNNSIKPIQVSPLETIDQLVTRVRKTVKENEYIKIKIN